MILSHSAVGSAPTQKRSSYTCLADQKNYFIDTSVGERLISVPFLTNANIRCTGTEFS